MFWNNLKAFYAQPFEGASEMDVTDWFAFIGVLLVLLAIWNLIFYHIAEGLKK